MNKSAKVIVRLLILSIYFIATSTIFAQCPTDYADNTADIPWTDTGGTLDPNACPPNTIANLNGRIDIVAAFNNARTTENGQIGTTIPATMTVNQLAADDAAWNAKSNSEKTLILMNLERVARGIPPFEGVDPNVVNVAQSYADYLRTTDQFDHDLNCIPAPVAPATCGPTYRMEQNAAIKTHQEFACRSENLAAVYAPSIACAPLPLEQAIYSWIYNDTGQGNGHRKAAFYNIPVANDNYGVAGKEGLIGVGVSIGPYNSVAYGIVMVFNFFDPDASYNAALPVELTAFSANLNNNLVELNWETATEVNNYGFDVERKSLKQVQNDSWEKVGFVEGHGNSNSPKYYSYTDKSLESSGKYSYRLKQVDIDGTFEYSDEIEADLGLPQNYELKQNYPNPFNPTTSVSFSIPNDGLVNLTIYDVLGNEVARLENGYKSAGTYSYQFDASDLTSGIYFYSIKSGKFLQTKKMLLMK